MKYSAIFLAITKMNENAALQQTSGLSTSSKYIHDAITRYDVFNNYHLTVRYRFIIELHWLSDTFARQFGLGLLLLLFKPDKKCFQ